MTYQAPVDDIMFALKTAAGLSGLIEQGVVGVDEETVRAVLEEAGKFGAEVLAPLNATGDKSPARLVNGVVETPPGWKEAYAAFAAGGWTSLAADEALGGQGLPEVVSMAACEIWNSANLAFGLCPLLTQGAIDAISAHGSDNLKATYLPKMATGQWTGTMNLTEPHAGSDLGHLRSKAERRPDGSYRITGTKIFITYGDHELTENIIHLVLARLPDAAPGTRGISLFLVPKRLVNADGSLGARNDVICASLEHKLGIHASPTCVMKFGESGEGAIGYLVGEENRGLNTMFIMMNAARLAVGVQGVAIAERATQHALAYARERKQGRSARGKSGEMSPIIEHADVRRNLMTMKAMTQAARAICLVTARELDIAHAATDPAAKAAAHNRAALLTPIAKAYSTDIGIEVASIGVQIHGGMGFIEETGAAQHYRDARILPIYEGTNGIHANDLVFRKLGRDGGAAAASFIADVNAVVDALARAPGDDAAAISSQLRRGAAALGEATTKLVAEQAREPRAAAAGAAPYLRLFGLVAGGFVMAKAAIIALRALAAGETNAAFLRAKLVSARFYADHWLSAAPSLVHAATAASASILALDDAEI